MAELNLISSHYHSAQKTDANVRTRREKEGQCANCGLQTHRLEKKHVFQRRPTRVPLTISGQVLRGRCLLCNPLPETKQQQQQQQQQNTLNQQPAKIALNLPLSPTAQHQHQLTTAKLPPVNSVSKNYGRWQTPKVPAYNSQTIDVASSIALLRHTSNENEAFKALEHLNGQDKRRETVNTGGVAVVVSAMKRFPGSWRVQNSSIQLLGNLVFIDSSSSAMKEAILLIISGTERFISENAGVGSCSLCFAAQANKNLIRSANGIPRFVVLFKKIGMKEASRSDLTGSNMDFMIRTVILLTNQNAENRRAVAGAGITSAIVQEMNRHSGDYNLLQGGCTALASIGGSDGAYANEIVRKGGIVAIQNALRSSLSPWLMSGPSQFLTGRTHSWSLSERVAEKAISALLTLSHSLVVMNSLRGRRQEVRSLLQRAIETFPKVRNFALVTLGKL